jgi:hypothetical protein
LIILEFMALFIYSSNFKHHSQTNPAKVKTQWSECDNKERNEFDNPKFLDIQNSKCTQKCKLLAHRIFDNQQRIIIYNLMYILRYISAVNTFTW